MSIEYKLESGRFVCYLQGERILETEVVMLLVDQASNTLHKHGDRAWVQQDLMRMQAGFMQAGFPAMAEDLIMIEGPRDLDELNQLLQCTGYVGVYLKKRTEMAAAQTAAVLEGFTLHSGASSARNFPAQ